MRIIGQKLNIKIKKSNGINSGKLKIMNEESLTFALMKRIRFNILSFAFVQLTVLFSGCAVVRKPYFQSDYYNKTISGLEQAKPAVKILTDTLFAGFSKSLLIPGSEAINKGRNKRKEIPIAGYGQLKTKYATGIHDSVFVRAVALKTGSDTSIIVSAELLIMPPDIIDSVVTKLSVNGIKRNQLFFSSTHAHSSIGGWGYGIMAKLMAGKRNTSICGFLANSISQAALSAIEDLKPASIGTGFFDAPQYTINRLTRNPEHNNTSFDYMLVEQLNGRKAVVGTYSAHTTTLPSENTLISGDYPGYWSRKIEKSGIDVGLFCAGSMAGQSPAGKGKDFESSAFIGESLADSVLAGLSRIRTSPVLTASSITLKTNLPEYHFRFTAKRNFTTGFSRMLMPAPENVCLQALRLNKVIWFFTPGDFSGESAILLRRLMKGDGYRSVVSGYNGSYVGYIIPGKYFYLDHYEPRMMGWFGPTMGDYIFELMDRMGKAVE